MAKSLQQFAGMQCSHGGVIQVIPAQQRAKAGAALLATTADSFIVVGCPFQLPGPIPSPCVRVQWVVPNQRVRASGAATLSDDSVGLCINANQIPQGKVVVQSTQPAVKSL